MPDGGEKILSDLRRHQGLFDLAGSGLGDDLAGVAADATAGHFHGQADPDGTPWPELSSDYQRWKSAHFPGLPMGVLTGELREGLEGDRAVDESSATYTFGTTEGQRDKAQWLQDPDPAGNRPPRRFVGLGEEGRAESAERIEDHFRENV